MVWLGCKDCVVTMYDMLIFQANMRGGYTSVWLGFEGGYGLYVSEVWLDVKGL